MTDLPARCPKCGTHVVVVVGKRAWCVLPYTEGGCGWTGTASAVHR